MRGHGRKPKTKKKKKLPKDREKEDRYYSKKSEAGFPDRADYASSLEGSGCKLIS